MVSKCTWTKFNFDQNIFKNFELSYHLLICRCLVWDKITMLWIHWAIVEECWVNSIWDYSFCILWIFFSCKFIPHLSIPPSTLNIIDLKVEKCRKIKSYKIIRELLFVWQVGMQIYHSILSGLWEWFSMYRYIYVYNIFVTDSSVKKNGLNHI